MKATVKEGIKGFSGKLDGVDGQYTGNILLPPPPKTDSDAPRSQDAGIWLERFKSLNHVT
ncbi:MAG: hypothetical protein CVU50_05100 [Candidatus Cloacimonetes bacterium HGW-Cloacimonetes-3]|jgi:hypothetical protein|nr:MAG: hypothetical protein CVU50_05100 [Candidatus Cloacimonetes bacterium HGW-Cloacimonetes-3]